MLDETSVDLYMVHARELIRFATGLVGPSDAQDVVADAMHRLFGSSVWVDATNRRALMFRAVLYEAQMYQRSRWRRKRREARVAGPEAFELPEFDPAVARAVSDLSPQQRAVVFLTYWHDLDSSAVAELLGVSAGTVRKQLGRARSKLREALS